MLCSTAAVALVLFGTPRKPGTTTTPPKKSSLMDSDDWRSLKRSLTRWSLKLSARTASATLQPSLFVENGNHASKWLERSYETFRSHVSCPVHFALWPQTSARAASEVETDWNRIVVNPFEADDTTVKRCCQCNTRTQLRLFSSLATNVRYTLFPMRPVRW